MVLYKLSTLCSPLCTSNTLFLQSQTFLCIDIVDGFLRLNTYKEKEVCKAGSNLGPKMITFVTHSFSTKLFLLRLQEKFVNLEQQGRRLEGVM